MLDIFEDEWIAGGITDEGMPPIGAMPRLRVLSLWCDRITGSCLEPLRGSKSLEELEFYGSPISAAGFENIGDITNLKSLYLKQLDVSDSDLSQLRNLTALTKLTLDNNQSRITDAGIAHLSGMSALEWLDLTGCQITGRALHSLKSMTRLNASSTWGGPTSTMLASKVVCQVSATRNPGASPDQGHGRGIGPSQGIEELEEAVDILYEGHAASRRRFEEGDPDTHGRPLTPGKSSSFRQPHSGLARGLAGAALPRRSVLHSGEAGLCRRVDD